jgi:hypothetical protein
MYLSACVVPLTLTATGAAAVAVATDAIHIVGITHVRACRVQKQDKIDDDVLELVSFIHLSDHILSDNAEVRVHYLLSIWILQTVQAEKGP